MCAYKVSEPPLPRPGHLKRRDMEAKPFEIKECPFRGEKEGKVEVERDSEDGSRDWKVICHFCGAKGPSTDGSIEAITLWNKRV